MKIAPSFFLVFTAQFLPLTLLCPAEEFSLSIRPTVPGIELCWPAAVHDPQDGSLYLQYEVQVSHDLVNWKTAATNLEGSPGSNEVLRLPLSLNSGLAPVFYRVRGLRALRASETTGDGGAEVFGYSSQMETQMSLLHPLSLEDFATNGTQIPYLPNITWDPAIASYWTNVSSRLDDRAKAIIKTNGFVARPGSTFGEVYYETFISDLPVFITADSILHAWHRSYGKMLKEVEEKFLIASLGQLLTGMSAQVPKAWQEHGSGPLGECILDADFFLTVARSLLSGSRVSCAIPDTTQDQRVTQALGAIANLGLAQINLFGSERMVDFSQFKVRGHYDTSDALRNYFKAMMWCGKIHLRLATFEPNREDDIRQLGTCVVLQHLLAESGKYEKWASIERTTGTFVGITDSLTFGSMSNLLESANIHTLAEVPDRATLTNLQNLLLTTDLGVQNVRSDFLWSPLDERLKLPRSFTLCGQKFVLDSWALSQMVWDTASLMRRKPSCIDVAYSVLGNEHIVPELVVRMERTNGVPWRDGVQYQSNLQAVRRIVDGHPARFWTNSIYNAWLAALRALSAPTTDPKYPEAMRTRAWAMKTLNTQMASWTQLRHDTLLYVKQSYTEPALCGYPHGFVEPRPEFWRQMRVLAESTAQGLAKAQISLQWTSFLNEFAETMSVLEGIADKELAQQPLSGTENVFLQDVIQTYADYVGIVQWNGWYPRLFYGDPFVAPGEYHDCLKPDVIVADVHTDMADEVTGDPGAVIHEGVRDVKTLFVAVDSGPDRMIYVGPIFSHYEFEEPGLQRLSDKEWETYPIPPLPPWAECYQ